MNIENFIPLQTICTCYQTQSSFVNELGEIGLIEIHTIEETHYIHQDQIRDIEKMIRLHHELDVNSEGIDVVFNLLQRVNELKEELKQVRNRLKIYEG